MTVFNTLRDGARISHRRQEPAGDWVWCASRQDTSRLTRWAEYSEHCSHCYLGHAHTLELHNERVEAAAMMAAS